MIFNIFYQVNLTGSGLFNRTAAEIGINLIKNAKKSFFIIGKIKKYLKYPALLPTLKHRGKKGIKLSWLSGQHWWSALLPSPGGHRLHEAADQAEGGHDGQGKGHSRLPGPVHRGQGQAVARLPHPRLYRRDSFQVEKTGFKNLSNPFLPDCMTCISRIFKTFPDFPDFENIFLCYFSIFKTWTADLLCQIHILFYIKKH